MMTETAAPPPTPAEKAKARQEEYSFEEFRMMYESTECVSDRKIAFMRNNSQLCLAIIAGQGIAAHWSFDETANMEWAIAFTVMVIGALGVFFCLYWVDQLKNLRALNAAKFAVLNEMSGYVVFPEYDDKARNIRSKNPFQREWEIMQKDKVVVVKEGRAEPKAKDAEANVPLGFLVFFGVSAVLAAVWLATELAPMLPHGA